MKAPLLAAMLLLSPATVLAASPFDGTWKIDTANAQAPDRPAAFLLQGGTFSCESCDVPFKVQADGAAHPISGNPYVDSVAIKIVDGRTVVETETKGGKTVFTYTMTVSPDRQSMTTVFTDNSAANGVAAGGTIVQERKKMAPTGSHPISGEWRATKYEGFSDSAIVFTVKLDGDAVSFSQPTGQSYTATLGGPAVPYIGDAGITTVSVARSGDAVVESDMRDGKVVSTNTMSTRDGKTMTVVFVDVVRNSTQSFTALRQ